MKYDEIRQSAMKYLKKVFDNTTTEKDAASINAACAIVLSLVPEEVKDDCTKT